MEQGNQPEAVVFAENCRSSRLLFLCDKAGDRKGLTLKLELRGYMNISHPGTQISKPGYLKQRMKLNPAAFVDLYQFHNRNFYTDPETELYTINGFLVLAADGSTLPDQNRARASHENDVSALCTWRD